MSLRITSRLVRRCTTDEAAHYKWMKSHYAHALVKHYLNEYVRNDVTTNRIEGAFGHFKRAVHGVYHKVSDEHINRYLQMFAWRWNRRNGRARQRDAKSDEAPPHHL